jgi:hypothetical protein
MEWREGGMEVDRVEDERRQGTREMQGTEKGEE